MHPARRGVDDTSCHLPSRRRQLEGGRRLHLCALRSSVLHSSSITKLLLSSSAQQLPAMVLLSALCVAALLLLGASGASPGLKSI